MCDKPVPFPRLFLSLLLVALQPALSFAAFHDLRYIELPGDLVDAEINSAGDVFLLMRGLPHLVILSADGSTTEYDLGEIVLPGGMCVDQTWGWYATGEVTDMVYRYDRNGVLMDSWEAGRLPGDISIAGLSVLYVSRAEGRIRSLRDPDAEVAALQGSGEGQLTPFGNRFVYSAPDESMVLGEFHAPQPLPSSGTWSSEGETLVVLLDSCLCTRDGMELLRLPAEHEFSRVSFSSGGGYCLLWSPGEERAMVLR